MKCGVDGTKIKKKLKFFEVFKYWELKGGKSPEDFLVFK